MRPVRSGEAETRLTMPIAATARPIVKMGHSKFCKSLRSIPGIQIRLVFEEARHHLARDRRRGAAAVAAVLDQHRDHQPRRIGWHERDEPGVVALLVLDVLEVRTRTGGQTDDLRGSGL